MKNAPRWQAIGASKGFHMESIPEQSHIPDGWQVVTLRGDTYEGQQVNIPADQQDIVVFDDTRPIRYSRFRPGAVELHSDDRLAAMLGGRR